MGCASSSTSIIPRRQYDGTKDHALEADRDSSVHTQKLISENTSTTLKVDDVYIISGALGSGATSTVRKATHKTTGDVFALKTLQLNRMTPEMREMLASEVKIMKRLDHPNIIQLKATYVEIHKLHIVMECCSGGELFDRLIDNVDPPGHFDEETTQRYCISISSALKYLHDNNICHRDLKLENFLLTTKAKDADIKVIDFGMSRSFLEGNRFSDTCGTVFYMAPEVADQRISYTEASDMWSFGVIVFALLSGGLPFGGMGMSDEAILALIMKGKCNMTSSKWTSVSDDAKDFVASLLVFDPTKRMSATDALTHVFLTKKITNTVTEGSSSGPENNATNAAETHTLLPVRSLRKFREYGVLKRMVLSVIAFNLGEEDVAAMRKAFQTFDVEKNGVVTFEEFTQVMEAQSGVMDNDEIKKIFDSIDQDHTGIIKYSEFLAACVSEKNILNEQRILDAFNKLDVDKTGDLNKSNLRSFLGEGIDEVTFNKMFDDIDLAGDGVVSLSEFRTMLREKSGSNEVARRSGSDVQYR